MVDEGRIDPLVSERLPLDAVGDGVQRLADGTTTGRVVFDAGSARDRLHHGHRARRARRAHRAHRGAYGDPPGLDSRPCAAGWTAPPPGCSTGR